MKKIFLKIKYNIARFVEQFPRINFLLLNNLRFLKFLLPHDKDYLGVKLICKNRLDHEIIDVGGNIGASILSFRSLGLKNKIYVFEPNSNLVNKYLSKIQSKDSNIEILNYGLGNKETNKTLYIPYLKNLSLHTYSSFNKVFLEKGLKKNLPNFEIEIQEEKINIKKFDNLKFIKNPHFIKIDAEGFEVQIIEGMHLTIKKYMPIFLIEYNHQEFKKIIQILPDYDAYIFNVELNNFNSLETKKYTDLRNFYMIPKKYKW